MVNLYRILELEWGAGAEEIKKAYRKQALNFHPDKNPKCHTQHYSIYYNIIATVNKVLTDP